ncbi:MAG: mevalonate kinase [Flavobacteriales bacterium]|nr:mevalonate kinase [Flavobacteriales bacterium]
MKNPLFYAKILLFGEYGIIENGKGLTLPYNFYKGTLKYRDVSDCEIQSKSSESLYKLYNYLKDLELPKKFQLNLSKLENDLNKGLFFDSNIPQGYGVGSSGALIAAVFDEYSINKITPQTITKEELIDLKSIFGKMESFFHGKSSGIDPLICFMNIPLLINSNSDIDKIGVNEDVLGKGAIFLIDSGTTGDTEPMVSLFFEKLKNEGFRKTLQEEFIKYNNACIHSFVKKELNPFFSNLKKLSSWAFEHFRPMIPESMVKIWEQGIESDAYYLKLCGSGGGGFILGFAPDYQKADKLLKSYNKEVIYRF